MPNMTEAQLFKAFGLDPEQGAEGGKEQDPADPVTEEPADEGGNDQEFAEPEDETGAETDTGSEDSAQPEEEDKESPDKKPPLTPEQRRANAARRRQEEQQQAINAAVEAERKRNEAQIADVFARAGLKNTVTGEPIKTMEEFIAWQDQFQAAQLQQQLQAGKLTPEMINTIVESNPVVQQARQVMEQTQAAQAARAEAADKARIDAEIAEIRKLNPEIQGFGDILKMDTAPKFREYIGLGYRAIDAYRLANMEAISQKMGQQAAQAQARKIQGKDHLRSSGNARGAGDVSVPPDQMRMFRALNPGKTDAEITKFYNQHLRKQGG